MWRHYNARWIGLNRRYPVPGHSDWYRDDPDWKISDSMPTGMLEKLSGVPSD